MPGDLIFQAMPNLLSNVLTIAELHITNKVKGFSGFWALSSAWKLELQSIVTFCASLSKDRHACSVVKAWSTLFKQELELFKHRKISRLSTECCIPFEISKFLIYCFILYISVVLFL